MVCQTCGTDYGDPAVAPDSLREALAAYEPCHGADELHERHVAYCVPFYEWRASVLAAHPDPDPAPVADRDALWDRRCATVRYRSPGGRWLTVTVEPACICDQITSRLLACPVHPTRIIPPTRPGGGAVSALRLDPDHPRDLVWHAMTLTALLADAGRWLRRRTR